MNEPEYHTSIHCGSGSCVEVAYQTSTYCSYGGCVEVGFETSSHCADGACVEVGFETSSFCGSSACVEVDRTSDAPHVLVRDSKDLSIAPLVFTAEEWRDFLAGAKGGEFDLPE